MHQTNLKVFRWILVIFVILAISVFSARAVRSNNNGIECPAKCMCFSKNVRCMLQKLNWIPRVPTNTSVLDLRFNNIGTLRPGVLRGLNELHTLLLNDNHIRHLPADVFEGAPNLRILYLYKNRIENIEPGAFAGLPKLEQLYLHHNRLTEIKKGTFNDLPALERLFLQNNRLHRLPADAFRNVGPMTRLRLDSNALVCDCNLMWLVERLQEKPTETEIAAICQSPEEMKGRSLTAMTIDEFHCTKPLIMEGPKDTRVKLGDTMVFTCRVYGDPTPDVKWMRDSNEVSPDGERYVIREDGSLVISFVTERDTGEYECVASSEMGSTKSRKARALITVSPSLRFTELPRSKTVRAGTDVTFVCRVEVQTDQSSSVNSPPIQWWKNGQPLISTGRVNIDENGNVLRILAVKESDTARYICRARNVDGFAETSADLKVLSAESNPPRLTYQPPENMEVEAGVSIELPCRAEGQPKPTMQWKKDGSAIESLRSRVSRGGSLYLYNVTIQDSGRYECSAVNEYGRATGQTVLRVQRAESNDFLVIKAFRDATEEIDRAINRTLARLFNTDGSHRPVTDPFRLSRFPDAVGRAAARPAELFERTLINIRRMVNAGATANLTTDFRYEDILTPEQIREIEKLSGCTGHRIKRNCTNTCYHKKYRSIDGSCNNLRHPTWGSSYTGFRRILHPIYENGFSTPIGWTKGHLYHGYPKPAARLISTTLISTHDITSDDHITHMVMQWGQFLDHDLDHALPSVSSESWDGIDCKKSCDNAAPCFPMEVPPGDPRIGNRRCIDFIRTSAVCGSGMTSVLWGGGLKPREQLNQLTSYLDASQVYGYDEELAKDLRDLTTDRGLLREGPTIPGRKALLPYMRAGQFVDCRRDPLESAINCFVAGDIRANEQVGLLAMHTIWLREHNRIARQLKEMNPHWNGEKLYQEARRIVGAEMQHISFQHWLPAVLGGNIDDLVGPYRGYDPNLDASISNVFATAALRFGHSLIQPRLERLNESFQSIPQGPLNLRDAFFSPWRLVDEGGVDPLIRGMFATPAKLKLPEQNLNVELTEQLFRTAHAVALDLAAMNIQRGREHGIPGYLEWRQFCNMSRVERFEDLAGEISNARVRQKLRELYGHPGNIDVWVGGILEDQLPGAKVGPLFKCILLEQFKRMRDGDRFWYESPSVFKPEQLAQIKQTSLARILCDNGDNISRIQPDVFYLPVRDNNFIDCNRVPFIDLQMWSDCCDNCQDQDNTIPRFRRAAEKYSAAANNVTLVSQYQLSQQVYDLQQAMNENKKESKKLKQHIRGLNKRIEELEKLVTRQHTTNYLQ